MAAFMLCWTSFWFGIVLGFVLFIVSTANFKRIGWWFFYHHLGGDRRRLY